MTATVTQPLPGGDTVPTRRRRAGRWTFDKISFLVVFLGVPLAIYLVLVVSPFAQAVYYSMTDWTGFSPNQNFVGLANFKKVFTDDIFLKSMRNNIVLAIVLPIVTLALSFALASLLTVGGTMKGQTRGLRGLRVLPHGLLLPVRDPGHRDRHHVAADLRSRATGC